VNRTRDRYNERAVEQQIIQDVKQALNSINLANATIETAIRARDLARKNVQAEQQKYELAPSPPLKCWIPRRSSQVRRALC
jgi:outer membrane protein TolC